MSYPTYRQAPGGRLPNRPLQRAETRVTRLAERQQSARRSAGPLNG